MQYICEAPPKTWFRIETVAEAGFESRAMEHAVERYFRQAYGHAAPLDAEAGANDAAVEIGHHRLVHVVDPMGLLAQEAQAEILDAEHDVAAHHRFEARAVGVAVVRRRPAQRARRNRVGEEFG